MCEILHTLAVIEEVYPNIGSVKGGTRISVSLNVAVSNYSVDDIQVFVGGEEVSHIYEGDGVLNSHYTFVC